MLKNMSNMDKSMRAIEKNLNFSEFFFSRFSQKGTAHTKVTWKRTCDFDMRICTSIKKRGRKVVFSCSHNHHNFGFMMTAY